MLLLCILHSASNNFSVTKRKLWRDDSRTIKREWMYRSQRCGKGTVDKMTRSLSLVSKRSQKSKVKKRFR
jgi:hypothetical protein